MVKVAKAYGFEGWFINEETDGLSAEDAAITKPYSTSQRKSLILQSDVV